MSKLHDDEKLTGVFLAAHRDPDRDPDPVLILGINAYHGDSSACLLRDGVLIAAAEEERFRRIKHWAGFPSHAIHYCLDEGRVTLADLDHVALNQDTRASFWRRLAFAVRSRPDPSMILDRLRNRGKRASVLEDLGRIGGGRCRARLHAVEHHRAHMSSAFHVSPFEEADVVSVDGFGDFASAAWGGGSGSGLTIDGRVHFPHSLGVFYQAMTQWLGFPRYGDEYKVMGLAPYGQPRYLAEMRRIVPLQEDGSFHLALEFFRHDKEKIEYQWDNGEPFVGTLFGPKLSELLGPPRRESEELSQRHKDVAASVQAMYEEAFFHLLESLFERRGSRNLALAGGCAMNSVANGKVLRKSPYRKIYVQSAAGDAGGAIGAAFTVWHALGGPRGFMMDHAQWGPRFGPETIRDAIEKARPELDKGRCSVELIADEGALCRQTAAVISEGRVIGWFQGRMEWGPRALGNRSILCDPRRTDMKDILNLKIKRRESFRPFAPSILREAVPDWFETDDDVPFMMQVYQIRPEKRPVIPAVTHVDGSGRLQTVHRDANPRYYRLIDAFRDLTGIPLLLNTSFNENEPVVCRPEEALDCFLRTNMDVLVLEDWIIRR